MIRRVLLLLIVATTAAGVLFSLPAKARSLAGPDARVGHPFRGAVHVHTRRSDGSGTVEDVMAAAGRAGLDFVIVTDHGDATRAPDAPVYFGRALYIDAVEITTEGGHVLGLGLPEAPYALAGQPRDVLEDIARLGGISIVAHPTSDKESARWTEWTAPFSGLEWLNADSEWRDERPPQLLRTLLTYPFRPVETLGSILDRADDTLRRWDELTVRRRVIAIAAADAHARITASRDKASALSRIAVNAPPYETVFRAFSMSLPAMTRTGDAARDAAEVIEQFRAGRVYSTIDSLAFPGSLTFTASSGRHRATLGETLELDGPVSVDAAVDAPDDATMVLFRNGVEVARATGRTLTHKTDAAPGVYRVEVMLPEARGEPSVPWILSNPIYVGRPIVDEAPGARAPGRSSVPVPMDAKLWSIEKTARSQAALDVVGTPAAGPQAVVRFGLGGPSSESPYAAAVLPLAVPAGYDRVTFRVRADRPMRISVQLRAPGGAIGARWHRSVYASETPRDVSVFFDEMTHPGAVTETFPQLASVDALMFVADTVNTKSGTSGQFGVENIRFER